MEGSTWAGVATVIAASGTCVATIVAAYTNFKATSRVDQKVSEVKHIVNSANEKLMKEVSFLKQALARSENERDKLEAGVPSEEVPPTAKES